MLMQEGESILDASMSWKSEKQFGDVETFSYTAPRDSGQGDSPTWYCRVSEHRKDDITFDELWKNLGRNKIVNEQKYAPSISC
jgi:hypothetical protein